MKIGIFAGTFDPVHSGHVTFARAAIATAGLNTVIIVAEKNPYRKKPHASWDHRQAMIERATENIEAVDHNYQFAAELAHQHTMQNLLEVAKKHYGQHHEFWFLVGSDVFLHMHEWRDITHDSEYGGFVVSLRDEHTPAWLAQKQAQLQKQGMAVRCVLVENNKPHVRSSSIRQSIASSNRADLPAGVLAYITDHQLYTTATA